MIRRRRQIPKDAAGTLRALAPQKRKQQSVAHGRRDNSRAESPISRDTDATAYRAGSDSTPPFSSFDKTSHLTNDPDRHHPTASERVIAEVLEGNPVATANPSAMSDNLEIVPNDHEVSPREGAQIHTGDFEVREGRAVGHLTAADGVAVHISIVDQFNRVLGEEFSGPRHATSGSVFSPIPFSIQLSNACFTGHELKLIALANGTPFASSNCKLNVTGTLEVLSESRCAGWLFAPDAPSRVFELEVRRNGVCIASMQTGLDRADVSQVFADAVNPGFDAILPADQYRMTELASISICLSGTSTELFDGPYVLGNRAAAVSAARAVARFGLSNGAGMTDIGGALLRAAIANFLKDIRRDPSFILRKAPLRPVGVSSGARINIIIPVYRDVAVTKACITSVLAYRQVVTDRVIIVNDCSPDADMPSMLEHFSTTPNVFVLSNAENIGFVRSVNRAMAFCTDGTVLLLNSDTELFSGVLDELIRIAESASDIGTVTAISNNATIFSYPHAASRALALDDVDWPTVAAIALAQNSGMAIDVPTGHGFCLLLKRELLTALGYFDTIFGRGYGEENDFCARAADLGYRNVAAGGAFVLHRESVSFGDEVKSSQLAANIPVLQSRYPEYTPLIMEYERTDDLRRSRWAIDIQRLTAASRSGRGLALIVGNHLVGGTARAIRDLDEFVSAGSRDRITLECRNDGFMEVKAEAPLLRALFAPGEDDALFSVLSAACCDIVVVHQVLGFSSATIDRLGNWVKRYKSVFYAHDFYALCPRVTLVDAAGHFCNVAATAVCERCVSYGGAHMNTHATMRSATTHRDLFSKFISGFQQVITPSKSASAYLRRGFPQLRPIVIPHPEPTVEYPAAPRNGTNCDILLLGAINSDKGSLTLLKLARRAQLVSPDLRFHVVGYTDIDRQLNAVGNVTITGPYGPGGLEALLRRMPGRLALFLHGWPETYSYTLSEAVRFGFIPLVPDIGAPSDRVRAAGFGLVFSFPIDVDEVLEMIADISAARTQPWGKGASPRNFSSSDASIDATRHVFNMAPRIFT